MFGFRRLSVIVLNLVLFSKVLHLLAMARAAEISLTIDDFQMIADKTPFLADLMYILVHCVSIFGH